jgi:hypothetical protein
MTTIEEMVQRKGFELDTFDPLDDAIEAMQIELETFRGINTRLTANLTGRVAPEITYEWMHFPLNNDKIDTMNRQVAAKRTEFANSIMSIIQRKFKNLNFDGKEFGHFLKTQENEKFSARKIMLHFFEVYGPQEDLIALATIMKEAKNVIPHKKGGDWSEKTDNPLDMDVKGKVMRFDWLNESVAKAVSQLAAIVIGLEMPYEAVGWAKPIAGNSFSADYIQAVRLNKKWNGSMTFKTEKQLEAFRKALFMTPVDLLAQLPQCQGPRDQEA